MVEKPYSWAEGAPLYEHTRRKHKILRDYLARYLAVRCRLPQQSKFRIAIVDGFAGGGRYACGSPGSPIIFMEELRKATEQFNVRRADEGMSPLDIECLLILNDADVETTRLLKEHVEPLRAAIRVEVPRLHLRIEYRSLEFEVLYPEVKELLDSVGIQNVLVCLDQCGLRHVHTDTIRDIMRSFQSVEIFYTFMIKSLLAYLKKDDSHVLAARLAYLGVTPEDLEPLDNIVGKKEWLGSAERIVFDAFRGCAPYVSPFSINNPDGWRYWFIHFANSYRARQEYNIVLHQNSSMQAHFGRSGLDMLAFDPRDEGALYLFDVSGRDRARKELVEDIPRLVSAFGDALGVLEFYEAIYKATPAHMDDVHTAIIENPDMEVITEVGGERRKATSISPTDTLRMKRQRSFFPLFRTKTGKLI